MNKLVVALIAMMVYNISVAQGCQTTVIVSPDGKVTTCMVCPNVVTCQ